MNRSTITLLNVYSRDITVEPIRRWSDLARKVAPLILERYLKECATGERFGDFVIRKGYVAATTSGRDFHANLSTHLAA